MTEFTNSTAGRLQVDTLGRTLIHEHVMVGFPGWYMDARQPSYKRAEVLARVTDAFSKLHAHGVRSVVDPCPMDMGRDVELIAEVAQRSGINIIFSTGAYTEAQGIPFLFRQLDVEEITEIYVREIEDGVGGTGLKAGIIKIATGDGKVSDYERKLVTAAARAALITGLPILSHTENCSCGHDQIDIVTGEGVAAKQLLVGHSDGRDDPEYQLSLAERGAYVGFDRFGIEIIIPDQVRMKNVKKLVDAGHRDRVMMSHDTMACYLGGLARLPPAELANIVPNSKLTHLFENIIPELLTMGMKTEDFDRILIDNPRRFFAEAVQAPVTKAGS